MPHLTAIILTKNEARHVAECVASLRWADRVLVFDSLSDDDTLALARAAVSSSLWESKTSTRSAQRRLVTHSATWRASFLVRMMAVRCIGSQ